MAVLEFGSFAQMAKYISWTMAGIEANARAGVREVCEELLKATRSKFGTGRWQGAGEYPTWEPLKQQTIERKERGGYAVPNDLVRDEELKDSFYVEVDGLEGGVGSDLEKALVHEVGDPRHNTPARSTLGLSFAEREEAYKAIYDEYIAAIIVQGKIKKAYGAAITGGSST